MKSKTSLLILISLIAFFALSAIQVYLVYNTYILKRNAFISHVKNEIESIDYDMTLDSIGDVGLDYLQSQLKEYNSGKIAKEEVVNQSLKKIDTLNQAYKKIYRKRLKERHLEYAIQYQKVLESAVLLGDENDTIFPTGKSQNLRIFGDDFSLDKAHVINVSRNLSQQDYKNTVSGANESLSIEFKFRDYVKIIDEKSIIFKQMSGILLAAFLIFLIVVGLFYYSLRSLLKQRKINTVKTDFINNITHELKTPLTTLNIGTKSLRNKAILGNPKALNATLATIDRQNQRLQQLIDQVIHKSVKAENLQLQFKETELVSFLQQILTDYKMGITDQNVQFHTSFPREKISIPLDHFHFTTALINILDNAVKYNEGEKIIELKVSIEKDRVQITIKDNGIGIPKKELPQLFDKFYRVSNSDVHSYKSLGLGLFYTQQIIKAHHGSLQVKSKPGKGSLFLIKLSLDDA